VTIRCEGSALKLGATQALVHKMLFGLLTALPRLGNDISQAHAMSQPTWNRLTPQF